MSKQQPWQDLSEFMEAPSFMDYLESIKLTEVPKLEPMEEDDA